MVTVGGDSKIAVFNPFNYTVIAIKYDKWSTGFYCVKSLGPNSGYFATGGVDSTIKIWETSTFRFVRRLEGHADTVNTLEVMSNGYLASGSSDSTIKMWDTNTGRMVSFYSPGVRVVYIKRLSSGLLAATTESRKVYFVNMTSSSMVKFLTLGVTATAETLAMTLFNNGQVLAVAWDSSLTLINTSSLTSIKSISTSYSQFSLEYNALSNNFI